MLFQLLHSRVSLTKIAGLLEISPPTLYDKIDFLHQQALKFRGDRERALIGRKFEELFLSTDRQKLNVCCHVVTCAHDPRRPV